ncbi:VOC family protein [Candidatus Saccharibacteria bacterium]|nr:VOC family protein [Candidatus Saccharibacteria bacterium]
MKIEHVAIWVKDIDKVCEFYRKYFGGVIQPLYHNPTKQFTSRFITFDDGARLEIMHRPDINVGTLTESKSNILGFGNVHTSVAAALTLRMFHVEQFHLAFSVGSKEEVDRLTQQMSDDGITIAGQPRTTGDGYYESVVLDPEGNRIEITE